MGGVERQVPRHSSRFLARSSDGLGSGAAPLRIQDIFNHQGRRPWASVNFVTAHDGFTLNDLVTYNDKHNEANGENNADGTTNNRSWNCGVEGPTDDPNIRELRQRQIRNFLATLLFSQGTPMLVAGDEFGRGQNGNNNAYCQDNEISWVNWNYRERGESLIRFVQKLTRLRLKYPILRRNRFLTGEYNEELGLKDSTWINANGSEMNDSHWADKNMLCFGLLMDGRAQTTGIRQRGKEATVLLIVNASNQLVQFNMPSVAGASAWILLIDTNHPNAEGTPQLNVGATYGVTPKSLLLLGLQTEAN